MNGDTYEALDLRGLDKPMRFPLLEFMESVQVQIAQAFSVPRYLLKYCQAKPMACQYPKCPCGIYPRTPNG